MSRKLVVVGAGSAGCVLANRASTSSSNQVMLLEAGPDYADGSLPDDLLDGGRNSRTRHDWGYHHRPSPGQIRFPFPRGRVVGGSSAVNTCIAIRGQPEDYDEWAERGLSAWSWPHCLPAFRRLERDLDFGERAWHGDAGALPIRRHPPDEWTPWQEAFVEACRGLGYEQCEDTNRPDASGVGPHALNKLDGRRVSAADAWLTPEVRGRDNLTIRSETLVRRVLFEEGRAVGVEAERNGDVETIRGDEIVLCAGAINTPGILLRSGIGPREDLERLGVEPVSHNANVGARLLDHPGAAIFCLPRLFGGTSRTHDVIQTVLRYGSEFNDLPNDVIIQPGSTVPLPWVSLPLVSIMISLGKPKGTGELHYESADPRANPIIQSNLLAHPDDREMAMRAVEHAYEIARTPEAREIVHGVLWPRPADLKSRDRLEERITRICDSSYHPCGTVPMGPDDDPSAACDGRGRLRGLRGLRVADASLMPTIPSANIHLSVLMIGERIGRWLAGIEEASPTVVGTESEESASPT